MINLPTFVKESVILTNFQKEQLASVAVLPTDQEVDAIRSLPAIQELMNAFIGDESTRTTHLQLKAQEYILSDNLSMAWCVLLL